MRRREDERRWKERRKERRKRGGAEEEGRREGKEGRSRVHKLSKAGPITNGIFQNFVLEYL